ncbi:IS3 family transposase [Micromonospora sp. LOL_013]|uniref:IS3 family transposase n=1 Tax=Micromonospora sp. LOL_013 TaxID=3345414 RepID=UPI003A86B857
MAESFFGALKNERVSRVKYPTREAARRDVTAYIEFWYNRQRLHSAVGYRPLPGKSTQSSRTFKSRR